MPAQGWRAAELRWKPGPPGNYSIICLAMDAETVVVPGMSYYVTGGIGQSCGQGSQRETLSELCVLSMPYWPRDGLHQVIPLAPWIPGSQEKL
jgi:hypothetical protein